MGTVHGWRAVVVGVSLAAGTVGASAVRAAPADAHSCGFAGEAEVGQPLSVTVGVAVDTAIAIVAVEVEIPDSFALAQALASGPWQASVDGDTVRWTGGRAEPGSCAFFTLRGTPTERAVIQMPLRATLADGSAVRSSPTNADGLLPVVVYAGVDPFAPGDDDGDDGDGTPAWQAGVGLAGGVALVGGATWAVRAARRRVSAPRS
jgi:hypothetical protein